jgi:hypothetical protein
MKRECSTENAKRAARTALAALVFGLALFLFGLAQIAHGQQRFNRIYADQFPGDTVAAKVTAAQLQCNPNLLCGIVIDSQLAAYTEGTMPPKCAKCVWFDYRSPVGTNPLSYYRAKHTGLTGNFAAVQVPVQDAGVYRVTVVSWVTQTGTAGTCQAQITFQNEVVGAGGAEGGVLSLTVTTVPREAVRNHHVKAGGILTYAMNCTGITGSPVYSIEAIVEQIA